MKRKIDKLVRKDDKLTTYTATPASTEKWYTAGAINSSFVNGRIETSHQEMGTLPDHRAVYSAKVVNENFATKTVMLSPYN